MDKARIYGVFEFVGFHLCKKLLEKGIGVEGIHFNIDSEVYLEEKRLEIGRNSNFEELEESLTSKKEPEVVIISVYDWFMTYKASKSSAQKLFSELVQSLKETKSQLVFLLPIQMLSDWEEPEEMDDIKNLLSQTKGAGQSVQYFYLPTIFGPWQPDSFLFQGNLLNRIDNRNDQMKVREWPFDAIYVDDLLNPLIERIESAEAGSFMFESGIQKSWELCAELLELDTSIVSGWGEGKLKSAEDLKKVTLNEVTPCEQALTAQKKHNSMIIDHS